MSTRCKFRCESVEPNSDQEETVGIRLSAVTEGSEENAQFFRWTPAGQLTLFTVNKAAAEQFKPGAEYYIDISPA